MSNDLVEKLLEGYIPADERAWYPYEWPTKKWYTSSTNEAKIKKKKEITNLANEDFFFFCEVVMRDPKDFKLQIGLHDKFCYILQRLSDVTQLTDKQILNLLPRSHLKSTLGTINYSIWLLGRDPNLRIVILSDVLDLAQKFLSSIQAHIIHNARLHYVFPNLKPKMKDNFITKYANWNKNELTVKRTRLTIKEPSITLGSTETAKTGFHCDYLIFDDIVTENNANTPEKMAKVFQWEQDIQNTDDFDSIHVLHGTRYQDGDLYGDKIEGGMPYMLRQAIEDGKYIWTEPASIRRVEKKHKSLTPYNWACQYLNNPIVKGDAEFDESWLKRTKWNIDFIKKELPDSLAKTDSDFITEWHKTLNIYLGCDPGRTDKKKSDYCVIMVAGVDNRGRMFVLKFLRDRMKSPAITNKFIEYFDQWNPISGMIETYGGDEHIYNFVIKRMKEHKKPHFRVGEYDKPKMSGNDRIRGLEVPVEQGMIWIPDTKEGSEIEQEFLRFPYGKNDDLITTIAYMWTQQVRPKKVKKKTSNVVWLNGPQSFNRSGIQNWRLG